MRAREAASTVNTHDIWPKIVACLPACLRLAWFASRLVACAACDLLLARAATNSRPIAEIRINRRMLKKDLHYIAEHETMDLSFKGRAKKPTLNNC